MTFVYGFLGGMAGGGTIVLGVVYTARRALLRSPLAAMIKPSAFTVTSQSPAGIVQKP